MKKSGLSKLVIVSLFIGLALTGAANTSYIDRAVFHSERPQADRMRDSRRKPQQVLTFFGVKPGETVLDLLGGSGYYTELLARTVGETGKVYLQNNQSFYEAQSDKAVVKRLKDNRLPNVIRWDRELANLGIAEKSLDKVFLILFFHDFYWMEQDVDLVIKQLYRLLKPGGILGLIDHAAKEGTGIKDATGPESIHRIDEVFVVKTMESHDFTLIGESDLLRNDTDDRTKAFYSPELKGKPTDRFVLKFRRPLAK